ncbi:hypothetical protein [Deefgea salmonis]|uniref:Lipoprotein n=1 Tax=Deefgea salmonis TaxID=2875502 RepID=A0ABS8BLW2_9NEIS|nr:hypothetical protein [Deefgea salmonis]MCB5196576.1 hypothetical protein [Deefgea salmonis]
MTSKTKRHRIHATTISSLIICITILTLSGCAARAYTKSSGDLQASSQHNEPVCFLIAPIPSSIPHTIIGEIKGSKRWYGSFSEVLKVMANEARRVGADAVMDLETKTDMNAIAWARPTGKGIAIKITDRSTFDCGKLNGTLR